MKEYFDVLKENGGFADKKASREECHEKGLWHKAGVVFIVSKDNKKVLLQQRSSNKKLWPNLWDVSAGGHVMAGEFGYQAVIRETKEEIGIDLVKEDLEYLGTTTSENIKGDRIDRHFNEYYITHKNIDLDKIVLQKEETKDIKWFTKEEIIKRINNNYKDLTPKKECWIYLLKYFEINS